MLGPVYDAYEASTVRVLNIFGYFDFVVGFECESVEAGTHQRGLGPVCDSYEATVTVHGLSVFVLLFESSI